MKLKVIDGDRKGEIITPEEGISKVGRSSKNNIVIDDERVSTKHAEFRYDDGRLYLTDMSSRNGTFVNGNRIEAEEIELFLGDRVVIGLLVMEVIEGSR